MEQQQIPEALQGFHQEDARMILHAVTRFGWDLQDFLESRPGLRESLEEYHGEYFDREFPKVQRSNIIDATIDLYRERFRDFEK